MITGTIIVHRYYRFETGVRKRPAPAVMPSDLAPPDAKPSAHPKKRGRPLKGEAERAKPWLAFNLSKATYYRRKAAGTLP